MADETDDKIIRTMPLRHIMGVTISEMDMGSGRSDFMVGRLPKMLVYASLMNTEASRATTGVKEPVAVFIVSKADQPLSREVVGYLTIQDLKDTLAALEAQR